ncbi:MAG: acetate uptake transporter [Deltaproteobacteria bacterium]|nr:acetate uptake transporter [Deltaproteobacteria bacterium]
MSEETKVADPTALGLFAYGLSLTLLATIIGGFAGPFNSMTLGQIVFTGGVGLVLAGVYDFMRGNAFGGTAFTGYGLLFLSVSTFFFSTVIAKAAAGPAPAFSGWFHLMWAIFAFATFIGANAAKKWVMLQIALFTTGAFLLIQAIGLFTGSLASLLTIAGIVGIFSGLCAVYTAIAVLVNGAAGKNVIPA